jgi:hypothetical protein
MTPTRLLPTLAGLCLLLVAPNALHAQKLQTGTWTGTATSPDGQVYDVTYDVRMSGDTTTISVNAGAEGVYAFANLKILEDRITFNFTPGPTLNCTLMLQEDRSYRGDCIDESGGTGILHMVPPKKEGV